MLATLELGILIQSEITLNDYLPPLILRYNLNFLVTVEVFQSKDEILRFLMKKLMQH